MQSFPLTFYATLVSSSARIKYFKIPDRQKEKKKTKTLSDVANSPTFAETGSEPDFDINA